MKKAKLTKKYIDYLNNVRRTPIEIFYAVEERIGSRDIEALMHEVVFCISEKTEEQKEHKRRVIGFLIKNWKLYN